MGRYIPNRCRIRRAGWRLLAKLARHIVLDGSGGGAVAFRNQGQLSIARWHRPEDCERAINRALEIVVDGNERQPEPVQNEHRSA